MNTENEPQKPAWHVRVTTSREDEWTAKVVVDLIYGTVSRNADGKLIYSGDVHHTLRGATAEESCEAMARDLNARGYVPPERTAKTRAEGFRQRPNALGYQEYREFVLPESRQ